MEEPSETLTVTPGTWVRDAGPDPIRRTMRLAVAGAAEGVWTLHNSGPGWYMHLMHNGRGAGMAYWNDWDNVRDLIARESGPYGVSVTDKVTSLATGTPGLTLSMAKIVCVRAERDGHSAIVVDADGREVSFRRGPAVQAD